MYNILEQILENLTIFSIVWKIVIADLTNLVNSYKLKSLKNYFQNTSKFSDVNDLSYIIQLV